MSKKWTATAAAGIICAPVAAGLDFDQNVTPDVIFGSGNANGAFTVDRDNGVELGLRAKQRFPPDNIFNSNGDGTYTFFTGPGGSGAPTPRWSFEWTVNSNYDGSSGYVLDDLTYELGVDFDPGPGTNYLVFDHITPGTTIPYDPPTPPITFFDHAVGDNTTPNGGGTSYGDGPSYAAALAVDNVAQNSWRMDFFDEFPFDIFDPNQPGRYEFYLAAYDGAVEVARTNIAVIVEGENCLALVADEAQGDAHAAAGDQIEVTLMMSDLAAGAMVTGYQAFLSYDSSKLTYEGALSSYNGAGPFSLHIQDIDNAGVPIGELRLDGSVGFMDPPAAADAALATLVFTVAAECDPTAVVFDLSQDFDSELSFLGDPIPTCLVDSPDIVSDTSDPVITCPDDIVVNADAGGCDAILNVEATFDSAVSTCASQTPDCWYTDRYAPAIFESAMFDGDNRLRHGVDMADSEANRPAAFSSAFYNTQGRKYDVNIPVGQTLGADIWVPADAMANDRRAGMWGTTFNGNGDISGYPIIGFTSADDPDTAAVEGPRFRVYTQDVDQDPGNDYQPGWVNLLDLTAGDLGEWYRFETTLTSTAYEFRIYDDSDTLIASFDDAITFGSVRIGNVILQVYNFGDTYEVYWDNVTIGPAGPVVDDCDPAPMLTFERSDNAALGLDDPFPSGVTTITWTATDWLGNSSTCLQTVTVNPVNTVHVDIELAGVFIPTSRCIRFVTDDCGVGEDVTVMFVDHDAMPGTPVRALASFEVTCGAYLSMCAKDEQHTLWSTTDLSIVGDDYVGDALLVLEPGDNDNDGDVDINDVTLLIAQFGGPEPAGGCPWNGLRGADYSNNGNVGSEDYTLLSDRWLETSSCDCIMISPADSRRTRVPVSEIDPWLGASADLNGDGVIDVRDVEIFERRFGFDGSLSDRMRRNTRR